MEYETERRDNENGVGKKKRILVVDDEQLVIDFLFRFLVGIEGYEVVISKNGKEALDIFVDDQAFDLIITDISMPKMDGVELSRKIKEIVPHMPIILCSGFFAEGKPESVDVLLAKPIEFNILRSVVNGLLS